MGVYGGCEEDGADLEAEVDEDFGGAIVGEDVVF